MSKSTVRRLVALVAVAVLAFGAVGCTDDGGATSDGKAAELKRAQETVEEVIGNLEDLKSFSFTMEMEIEAQGQTIEMQAEGVAEDNYNPASAKVAMDTQMTLLGQTIDMSQVMLDGRMYLKYDPDPLGSDSQWYFMDFDISGTQTMAQGNNNPAEYLDYLKAYSSIEPKGTEEINGVECEHYFVVIDGEKIAEMAANNYKELADQLPEGAYEEFDEDALYELYADAEIEMDIFIGVDDRLPYRQVMRMGLTSPTEMDMVITMDFTDFNDPVDITAPAGAVPLPPELGGTQSAL